jgi:quercetin dioxygenase-like cupin family protein
MHIHHLYEDEQGESHWGDLEVEWTEQTVGGPQSDRLPATGVIFRQMPTTYDMDWHPAPRRQYIVILDGSVQITASDGEVRVLNTGEMALLEDVAGKGHLSKNMAGRPYHTLFVALD